MMWKDIPCVKDLIVECGNLCSLCPTDAFKVIIVFMLNIYAVPSSCSSCVRRTGRVCSKDRTTCACLFFFLYVVGPAWCSTSLKKNARKLLF